MKLHLAPDEWYPVVTLRQQPYNEDEFAPVELIEAEIAELLALEATFHKWQVELYRRARKDGADTVRPYQFQLVDLQDEEESGEAEPD